MARANRYQPSRHNGAAAVSQASGVFTGGVIPDRRRDVQPRDTVADLAQAQTQPGGCRGPVEAGFFQHFRQNVSLLLIKIILKIFRNRDKLFRRGIEVQFAAFAKRHGTVEQIFELPDIAVERVGAQTFHGRRTQGRHAESGFMADSGEQGRTKCRQIVAPVSQCRHADFNHIQPVIEVLPEGACLDLCVQVFVRGADDAYVDRIFLRRTQRPHHALLNGAQQLGLHGQRKVADLIEKQCAVFAA